jgi:hypothetical protein
MKTALTFAIMDAPFENSRTVTMFRLIAAALEAGHDVNVFAYEGAVALSFARQAPHANAVHGRDAAQENHPLPRVWIGPSSRSPRSTAASSTGSTAGCAWTSAASPRRSTACAAAHPRISGRCRSSQATR